MLPRLFSNQKLRKRYRSQDRSGWPDPIRRSHLWWENLMPHTR